MASSIDDDASRSIEEVFGSRQSNALVSNALVPANVADEFDPLSANRATERIISHETERLRIALEMAESMRKETDRKNQMLQEELERFRTQKYRINSGERYLPDFTRSVGSGSENAAAVAMLQLRRGETGAGSVPYYDTAAYVNSPDEHRNFTFCNDNSPVQVRMPVKLNFNENTEMRGVTQFEQGSQWNVEDVRQLAVQSTKLQRSFEHTVPAACDNKGMKQAEVKSSIPDTELKSLLEKLNMSVDKLAQNQVLLPDKSYAANLMSTSDKSKEMEKETESKVIKPLISLTEDAENTDMKAVEVGRRSFHMTTEKLGKFDGENVSLETFLVRFDAYAQHFTWSKEERLFHLKTALSGQASTVVWQASGIGEEEIIKRLKLRFGNDALIGRYREQLQNYKRQSGQSIQSMYSEIQRLMILGYPNETSEAVDSWGKCAFINAFQDVEFATKIRLQKPQTLNEAYVDALTTEQYAPPKENRSDQFEDRRRVRAIDSRSNEDVEERIRRAEKEAKDSKWELDKIRGENDFWRVMATSKAAAATNVPVQQDSQGGSMPPRKDYRQERSDRYNYQSNIGYGRGKTQYQNNGDRGRTYDKPRSDECYNCGEKGHIARFCISETKKKIPQGQGQVRKINKG